MRRIKPDEVRQAQRFSTGRERVDESLIERYREISEQEGDAFEERLDELDAPIGPRQSARGMRRAFCVGLALAGIAVGMVVGPVAAGAQPHRPSAGHARGHHPRRTHCGRGHERAHRADVEVGELEIYAQAEPETPALAAELQALEEGAEEDAEPPSEQ